MQDKLASFISRTFNAGRPVGLDESLFYSGMIDSFGIQQIANFITNETGSDFPATMIVEDDLDTINLLVERGRKLNDLV